MEKYSQIFLSFRDSLCNEVDQMMEDGNNPNWALVSNFVGGTDMASAIAKIHADEAIKEINEYRIENKGDGVDGYRVVHLPFDVARILAMRKCFVMRHKSRLDFYRDHLQGIQQTARAATSALARIDKTVALME